MQGPWKTRFSCRWCIKSVRWPIFFPAADCTGDHVIQRRERSLCTAVRLAVVAGLSSSSAGCGLPLASVKPKELCNLRCKRTSPTASTTFSKLSLVMRRSTQRKVLGVEVELWPLLTTPHVQSWPRIVQNHSLENSFTKFEAFTKALRQRIVVAIWPQPVLDRRMVCVLMAEEKCKSGDYSHRSFMYKASECSPERGGKPSRFLVPWCHCLFSGFVGAVISIICVEGSIVLNSVGAVWSRQLILCLSLLSERKSRIGRFGCGGWSKILIIGGVASQFSLQCQTGQPLTTHSLTFSVWHDWRVRSSTGANPTRVQSAPAELPK